MTLAETIKTLQTSALSFPTKDRALKITGADAKSWLQGQITQDIRLLATQSISSCLCNPKGQIESIVHIHEEEDHLILITEQPTVILQRIEDFVIMEDINATLLDFPVSTLQGVSASGSYCQDRTGYSGYDTLTTSDIPNGSVEHLSALEIAAGIPRFGIEIGAKTLPPELGPHFESQHISYTKGCYVGQEVIHRIHARGHTNKCLVGLIADKPIEPGSVTFEGKEIGSVHRSAPHSEFGFIASATLRNEATSNGTQVQINGVTATVQQLPLLG